MSELRKLMDSLDRIDEVFTGPVEEIADATANNDHTYAMILGAQWLKLPHIEEELNKIYQTHLELGHMPMELMNKRFELYKEMMDLARRGLSPQDFKRFHSAY